MLDLSIGWLLSNLRQEGRGSILITGLRFVLLTIFCPVNYIQVKYLGLG